MSDIVNFKFGADSTEAMRAIKGVQEGVQNIGKGMSLVSMESMLNIFGMLKGAVADMWQAFMGPAAEIENYTVSFETLLGSAEKAAEMVRTLNEYAASTPFELDGIAKATNTLLSFGLGAEEAVRVLKRLGDMAAVTRAPLADLARIYGKVNAVGVMDTVAVDMLSERGLNMRKVIAERDGISVAEVQKNIAKRQYGRAEMDYALGLATGEGGQFFEGTIKAGRTFSGVVSTLADNFKALRAEIGQEMMAPLKDAMGQLTEQLPAVSSAVKPLAEAMGGMVAGLVRNLPLVLRVVRDIVVSMAAMLVWPKIVAGAAAFKALMVSTRGVLAQMSTNIKAFGIGLGVCRTVGTALLGIFRAIGRVGWMLAITTAVEALSALYDKFFGASPAAPVDHSRQAMIDEMNDAVDAARKEAASDEETLAAIESKLKEAKTGEQMKAAADELTAEMRRLRNAYENAEDLSPDASRVREGTLQKAMALQDKVLSYERALREREKAAEVKAAREKNSSELLKKLLSVEEERNQAKFDESFKELTAADQLRVLGWLMRDFGYKGSNDFGALEAGMMDALGRYQASGDVTRFEAVRGLMKKLDVVRDTAANEAAQAFERDEVLRELEDREALLEAREKNNNIMLGRAEAAQEAAALARELESYGVPADFARAKAAEIVARERALAGKGAAGRSEYIADSLQRIGGGGRGFSIGDAQLSIARQQVNVAEKSRELLAAINKRLERVSGTIPVVP